MGSVGRAFVAVFPPDGVVDALDGRLDVARRAAPDLRWSPRADWHVTLRFLGRVADVDDVVARVGAAVAASPPVGALRCTGAGGFPEARRGSVLWVGLEESAGLATLAAAVDAACVDGGLAPDDRRFRPHLTVARARRPADLRPAVDAIGPGPVGDPWPVAEVRLVASDTRPSGAVYTDLARFPLTP